METAVTDDMFNARRLRAALAAERITRARFAAACGLSRVHTTNLLNGNLQPGELARFKLAKGIAVLGLGKELSRAAS